MSTHMGRNPFKNIKGKTSHFHMSDEKSDSQEKVSLASIKKKYKNTPISELLLVDLPSHSMMLIFKAALFVKDTVNRFT
jgi:hypothetical protein